MNVRKLNRRELLRLAALTGGSAFLASCAAPAATEAAAAAAVPAVSAASTQYAPPTKAPAAAVAPTATPVPVVAEPEVQPSPTPGIVGTGSIELNVWYQDWSGANGIMSAITPKFVEENPDVKVILQPIGYGDLQAKMLPAIASGTEGDIMMLYTDWMVGTDLTKVFLDITEPAGGYSAMEKKMYAAAFTTVDLPENKVYYLPWLSGVRGGVTTVNKAHTAEANIDYLKFKTFEDLTQAAIKMTKVSGGKMTRAGYSPISAQQTLLKTFSWQLGGEWFDKASGKFAFSTTPECEVAAQYIYDLFWKHKVVDHGLFDGEYAGVSSGLVSMWSEGAWSASAQNDAAGLDCDNFGTPPMANAKKNVLYPEHIAAWGLSKRLADAPSEKLQAALDYALEIVSPDALLLAMEFYSGTLMSKEVYADPRLMTTKFGAMSKQAAEGSWPYARFPGDHVANYGPAGVEFDRAMRQEISIKEALANMDTYLQSQEDEARERIG